MPRREWIRLEIASPLDFKPAKAATSRSAGRCDAGAGRGPGTPRHRRSAQMAAIPPTMMNSSAPRSCRNVRTCQRSSKFFGPTVAGCQAALRSSARMAFRTGAWTSGCHSRSWSPPIFLQDEGSWCGKRNDRRKWREAQPGDCRSGRVVGATTVTFSAGRGRTEFCVTCTGVGRR